MPPARLAGRNVIVTGASSGIGAAIARRCAAEGAAVLATGRRADALAALAAEIPERITAHAADLAADGAAETLVAAAAGEFGPLDGLVHAAGTVRRGEDPRTADTGAFRAFVEENLTPTYALARAAFAAMTLRGGSIVLLGSQLAHIGAPGYATYSAVKGGVTAMARALAADGGPLGIRVNVLAPGVVRTPMAYVDREDFDELEPTIAERHPLRRIGEPEDLAGPATFLLSDDAAWVTGHALVVDGGYTAV